MSSLVIAKALVLPMTEERKSVAGYVRVVDGVITEIGAGAPAKGVDKEESIDAAGCVLMPGLINAHTHLYQVLLRAVWEDLELMPWLKRIYGCARALRPEHFYAGSLLGYLDFDLNKKVFTRFDLLALGENWWNKHDPAHTLMGSVVPQYSYEKEYQQLLGRRIPVGVVFELAPPESGFAGAVPGGTHHWPTWPCDYWGTKNGK